MDLKELFACQLDLPGQAGRLDPQQLPAHGGVWLLVDQADRPIQLAACQDLRRSISARLNRTERPTGRADLAAIARRLWWQPGFSQFETSYEYWRVARRLYPKGYRKMVGFGPAWFIEVDPSARTPLLELTSDVYLRSRPTVYIGPFATRPDGSRFVEILQDLFALCRHPDILRRAPHAQACAYYEMGRCPAPCNGSIGLDQYRLTVAEAVGFACGRSARVVQELERQMASASQELQFERAASINKRIEAARALEARPFRFARHADRFAWLVIQRAGGTTRVKPFYVDRGRIRVGRPVRLGQVEQAAEEWLRQMQAGPDQPGGQPIDRAEATWLVSHFLFKQERAGGIYLDAATLKDACSVAELVQARFRRVRAGGPQTGTGGGEPPNS